MATNASPSEEQAIVKRLHGMVARKVQDFRVELMGIFEDQAKSQWAGQGHVTVNQFARAMDGFGFRLTREEITALCNIYCDTPLKSEFNYVAFCRDCDPLFGTSRCGYVPVKKDDSATADTGQGSPEAASRNLGNPYFDQFGQVKPLANTAAGKSAKAFTARTPRREAALLRNGFQPVGANIINPDSPRKSDVRNEQDASSPGSPSNTMANIKSADEDLARIQALVFRRRLRPKEFFKGWDPRQTGRITRGQFSRGIANIIHPNSFFDPEAPIDIDALTESFIDHSPEVMEPTVVNYNQFCHSMDSVFNKPGLENRPTTSVPRPGAGVLDAGGFAPRPVSDLAGFRQLLRRVSYLCDVWGIQLSTCFDQCQRSDTDIRTGRISTDGFVRHFPLAKSTPTQPAFLKRPDMELLIQRYTDDNGWVRLVAFQNELEDLRTKKMQPMTVKAAPTQKTGSKWIDQNSITTIVGKLGL